jgi:hypothetical protein
MQLCGIPHLRQTHLSPIWGFLKLVTHLRNYLQMPHFESSESHGLGMLSNPKELNITRYPSALRQSNKAIFKINHQWRFLARKINYTVHGEFSITTKTQLFHDFSCETSTCSYFSRKSPPFSSGISLPCHLRHSRNSQNTRGSWELGGVDAPLVGALPCFSIHFSS